MLEKPAIGKSWIVKLLLLLLSVSAGVFVFSTSACKRATLNIDATSLEKATGTVFFEGGSNRGSSSRTFEINEYPGDQGLKKLYVIELPAVGLKSLRIVPGIPGGAWGVERIVLASDTVSYSWDEQGICTQQITAHGGRTKKVCDDGAPTLSSPDGLSIAISALPAAGFTNALETRIVMSMVFAFGTFLVGAWLLRPVDEEMRSAVFHRYAVRIAWLAVALFFVFQLHLVVRYSVDVPTLDEWVAYFKQDGLIKGLTWRWLFGFQNEHQIVLTKLMAWLNLKLFGLSFVLQNLVNFFIFGGVLAALVAFKNRVTGREAFALFPLFMLFLLSPINYENHLWAYQSQFHLALLFSVLMLRHAYRGELALKSAAAFSLYAVLAMYSFSAGVIFVASYLLCVTVYVTAGIRGKRIGSRNGWRFLLTVCGLCGAALFLWSLGYGTHADPHPRVFPDDIRFWDFFLNIVSFGFGFESMHLLPGVVCLMLTLLPPALLLFRKDTRWQPSTWLVLSAVLGILAVLAAISVGRAWVYPPKTSRYAEIGFMLIPYSALGWWLVMKEGARRAAVLSLFWLFCCMAYFNDWSTKGHALFRQFNLYNLEYIEAYYAGAGNGTYPENSVPEDLDRAQKLGVRFTRHFGTPGGSGR